MKPKRVTVKVSNDDLELFYAEFGASLPTRPGTVVTQILKRYAHIIRARHNRGAVADQKQIELYQAYLERHK